MSSPRGLVVGGMCGMGLMGVGDLREGEAWVVGEMIVVLDEEEDAVDRVGRSGLDGFGLIVDDGRGGVEGREEGGDEAIFSSGRDGRGGGLVDGRRRDSGNGM